MPEVTRAIKPNGVEFKGRTYWDPILGPFVGTKKVLIKYDPFSMRQIWVKMGGVFYPVNTSDLTLPDLTFEEYRASRFHAATVRAGSLEFPKATSYYREKQSIEDSSKLLTKRARRQQAAAAAYGAAIAVSEDGNKNKMPTTKPNYSKIPHKFKAEN
jgi:putative transposase